MLLHSIINGTIFLNCQYKARIDRRSFRTHSDFCFCFSLTNSLLHLYIWGYICLLLVCRVRVIVFNATFNNISAISRRSILLVRETGEPGENHRPAASYWQILSHNVAAEFELATFMVIGSCLLFILNAACLAEK